MPLPALSRRLSRRTPAAALAGFGLGLMLYTATGSAANAEPWSEAERARVSDLRGHAMQRLVIHTEPKDRIAAEFVDADGATLTFADFEGRVLVVNFWATWCPPCRAEMPSLDRLSEQLGTEDFAVVALSTDFGGMAKPKAFFEEIGVTLPLYQDTTRGVAREAAVMGLPVTLLLDRSGREVARLIGDAEWDSPEAVAVLKAIAESGGPQG